jgi:hypothetical protein
VGNKDRDGIEMGPERFRMGSADKATTPTLHSAQKFHRGNFRARGEVYPVYHIRDIVLGAKVKQKRNYNELYSQNKESENMN